MSDTTTTVGEQDYKDGYVMLGDAKGGAPIAIKRNDAGEIIFYTVQKNDDGTLTLTLLNNPPELDAIDLEQYSAEELEELLDVLGAASGASVFTFLSSIGSKNLGKLMQLILKNAKERSSGQDFEELKNVFKNIVANLAAEGKTLSYVDGDGKTVEITPENFDSSELGNTLSSLASLVASGQADAATVDQLMEKLLNLCGSMLGSLSSGGGGGLVLFGSTSGGSGGDNKTVGGSGDIFRQGIGGTYSNLAMLELQIAFMLIAMCSLTRKSQLEAVLAEIQKAMDMALAAKATAIEAAGEAKTAAIIQGAFAIAGGIVSIGLSLWAFKAPKTTSQATTKVVDGKTVQTTQTMESKLPDVLFAIARSAESIAGGMGGVIGGQFTFKEKMLEAEVKMLEYLAELIRRVMTQVTEFASELKEMLEKFMQFIMGFLEAIAAVARDTAGKL